MGRKIKDLTVADSKIKGMSKNRIIRLWKYAIIYLLLKQYWTIEEQTRQLLRCL